MINKYDKGIIIILIIKIIIITCDRKLNALNISNKTKHVKVIVVSCRVTLLSDNSLKKIHKVPETISDEAVNTLNIKRPSKIESFARLGGCLTTYITRRKQTR